MELRELLTTENPLGPFHHERIMKRVNRSDSDLLLCQVGLFDQVIARGSPLIVGRRGSGKTAIVNAYLSAAGHTGYASGRGTRGGKSKNVYAFINSWDHLDDIIGKVGRDIQHSLGQDLDWSSVLPETVARKWSHRFWHVIFQQLYKEYREDDHRQIGRKLPGVVKYITGEDFLPEGSHISNEAIYESIVKLKNEVLDFFCSNGIQCFVIVDSLELYPIHSPKFMKTISGFLKCVNEFGDENPCVKIICCLPEEIEHVVYRSSSNRIKDLSTASSMSRLRWRPVDLLRIVADRYRDFLRIHVDDDPLFVSEIESLDLLDRRHLKQFFDHVLPATVTNRFGHAENSLAYLIRHTQLLPREFILLFGSAIVASHEQKGSWRFIEAEAIIQAVAEQESDLAEQILDPYRPLYPVLIDTAKAVISDLPPIFGKSEIDKLGAKLTNASRHEVDDPWAMLFDIGVIGYVENAAEAHPLYDYGRFHFNSNKKITFASDRRYCVHPLFSGSWELRQPGRGDTDKFIYPADVSVNVWEG